MQLLAVSVFRQTSPDVRVRVRRIVVAVDVPQACIQVIVPIAADIREILVLTGFRPLLCCGLYPATHHSAYFIYVLRPHLVTVWGYIFQAH